MLVYFITTSTQYLHLISMHSLTTGVILFHFSSLQFLDYTAEPCATKGGRVHLFYEQRWTDSYVVADPTDRKSVV